MRSPCIMLRYTMSRVGATARPRARGCSAVRGDMRSRTTALTGSFILLILFRYTPYEMVGLEKFCKNNCMVGGLITNTKINLNQYIDRLKHVSQIHLFNLNSNAFFFNLIILFRSSNIENNTEQLTPFVLLFFTHVLRSTDPRIACGAL